MACTPPVENQTGAGLGNETPQRVEVSRRRFQKFSSGNEPDGMDGQDTPKQAMKSSK